MCLVQLQAGPGSVWGLISSKEEDYNYCADGEDVDGEDEGNGDGEDEYDGE